MKRTLAIILALIGWITLIVRLKMRIETEDVAVIESVIRFLSFFTILSNLLVTIYFTSIALNQQKSNTILTRSGTLTALAAIMTFVGLAYHILLRALWDPTGIAMITDQIHHTIVPIGTVLFWALYEDKTKVSLKGVLKWLLYPILYLVYALIRGYFSGFYPYYFIDIGELGLKKVIINSLGLVFVLMVLMIVYYFLAKKLNTLKSYLP